MKFLIIAGPYEADLFRRAAFAAQIEALAIEPGDSLSGWIAAARPDLIVLSGQGLDAPVADVVARIRMVPGGDVPLVVLCDEAELAAFGAHRAHERGAQPRDGLVIERKLARLAANAIGAEESVVRHK